MTGTLDEIQCTFILVCRSVIRRMRNVSDYSCAENENTLYVQYFFFPKVVSFKIMWKKHGTARQATDYNTVLHMPGCRITKARIEREREREREREKHTLRICNTYFFYTAAMVMRKTTLCYGTPTLPILFVCVVLTLKRLIFWGS